MKSIRLEDVINKRLTLNLLIQGSAQHAFLTSHYLVRDELSAIDPSLLHLYDQFAIAGFVQYWHLCSSLISGRPGRFWRRTHKRRHPFHQHRLLARHGLELSLASKRRAFARSREKGVSRIPMIFSFQVIQLAGRLHFKEFRHLRALVNLAKEATHRVWGISPDLLDGQITGQVAFGDLTVPKSFAGVMLRASVAGYGGVVRDGDHLKVVARAWNWPLLSHELVKGTAELICLHGMSEFDDETCTSALRAADHIEYEPWMLQTGAELWRRLLPLVPGDLPLAEALMHIARLPPRSLEALMFAIIEDPDWARELLAHIAEREADVSSIL